MVKAITIFGLSIIINLFALFGGTMCLLLNLPELGRIFAFVAVAALFIFIFTWLPASGQIDERAK